MGFINVRSLTAHYCYINLLMNEKSYDIIMLCETWLKRVIFDENIRIEGYKLFRADRNVLGRSLCIYI